jgi:hypothetical protein
MVVPALMTLEMPMGIAVVSPPPMLHPVSMMAEFTMAEFATLAVMPMPPRHFPWVLPLDALGRGRCSP